MARIKLTKTVIEAARPAKKEYELRDTELRGFLCKVTPSGHKVFMLSYRTQSGQRRKPVIGLAGELTVQQARTIALEWRVEIRRGADPGGARKAARQAYTIAELCDRFLTEHSKRHNKPSTTECYRRYIETRIKPALGSTKVEELTRADVVAFMKRYGRAPTQTNRMLALLKKMFNCAEVWMIRAEGTNPCRLVPMFPSRGRTRLFTDDEVRTIYKTIAEVEREGALDRRLAAAFRLHFALAARVSEVCMLEWSFIDFDGRRITWPDSKTGGLTKIIGAEAIDLLKAMTPVAGSPFVFPSIRDPMKPFNKFTYAEAWASLLRRAGVPHAGTHAIRHRAATDIANSISNVRTGMAMTGHKTVVMFMRYVHAEEDRVRLATELVSEKRRALIEARPASSTADKDARDKPSGVDQRSGQPSAAFAAPRLEGASVEPAAPSSGENGARPQTHKKQL